ncbi:NB-ARC domain-containing protein [Candidatus Leptofilum sp.]|uniref:NB-ARC domain-containing protein n=1 Tax=Candidatus Leptofilum sp. TaxID=3241576 RepID=UPI003B5BFD69
MSQQAEELANVSFGAWVRHRRRVLDLTQAKLATQIGISRSFLRKIEADERRPSAQVAKLLADALSIPQDNKTVFLQVARGTQQVAKLNSRPSPLPQQTKQNREHPALPIPATPFIGRSQLLTQLAALLAQPELRLLTLIGPGGIGKTRISLEVAKRQQAHFADGVFFVNLVDIREPSLVMSAIAQQLNVRESGNQSVLADISESLGQRQLLLVLDNFEQVMAAATSVAQLLTAVPQLKIIVTSRELLRVSGEHLFWVPPLTLPNPEHSEQQVFESEAVRLFVAEARRIEPTFVVDEENGHAIIEICRRLDGLPLAIELAAARVRHLSPQLLLARLETRLPLLTGGVCDAPARQQTLTATLEWSFNLLDEAEKRLFIRLGMFRGGFTLTAVEQLCQPDLAEPVLEKLASLVDKSLVRQQTNQNMPRYYLYETIHEFALNLLTASGFLQKMQSRHANYYLTLAETAAPKLHRSEQITWLAALQNDHANFQQALTWFLQHQEAALALRFVAALGWYWTMRGHSLEGFRWLQQALALETEATPKIRARAIVNAAGRLTANFNRTELGHSLAQEALSLAREAEDHASEAWAIGWIALYAVQMQEPTNKIFDLFHQANQIFVEINHQFGMAWSYTALGIICAQEDKFEESKQYHKQSLATYEAEGNLWGIAQASQNLGLTLLKLGQHEETLPLFTRAYTLYEEINHIKGKGDVLCGLALVAAQYGRFTTALTILSTAQARLTQHNSWFGYPEELYYEDLLAKLRTQLDPEQFNAAWEAGLPLTFSEAFHLISQKQQIDDAKI